MKQESSVTVANAAETMDKVIMPCDNLFFALGTNTPFSFKGNQVPIRLVFALTLSKAQLRKCVTGSVCFFQNLDLLVDSYTLFALYFNH